MFASHSISGSAVSALAPPNQEIQPLVEPKRLDGRAVASRRWRFFEPVLDEP